MKNKLIFILHLMIFSFCVNVNGQSANVEVVEKTFKVAALMEQSFYYGFAAGDILVFSFEEQKGKELKQIEIIEYPTNAKFMDYKTKKIEGKEIKVNRTGIYQFKFVNTSLGGRVCKFHVLRKPKDSSSLSFNSSVSWKTVYDTSYTPTEERFFSK